MQPAALKDIDELAAFANDVLAKAVCPPSEVDAADEREFREERLRLLRDKDLGRLTAYRKV